MPAFMFEKISPSARREPLPVASETKPSGILMKMFGRLPGARVRTGKSPIQPNDSAGAAPAQD